MAITLLSESIAKIKAQELLDYKEKKRAWWEFETKFKPEMVLRIIQLGLCGRTLRQIARDLGISRRTLERWSQQDGKWYKKEVAAAKDLAEEYRAAFMDDVKLRELEKPTQHFNPLLLQMSYTSQVPSLKESVTYKQRAEALISALADGELNEHQAEKYANVIQTLANVEKTTELEARVADAETQIEKMKDGTLRKDKKSS